MRIPAGVGAATRRAGFTLIEVLIALTIGSLVVLMVHQAFGATGDLASRLDDTRVEHRHRMEAVARLTRAFGSLEIGTVAGTGFDGRTERVECASARADGRTGGQAVERTGGRAEIRRFGVSAAGGWLVLAVDGAPAESLLAADAVAFDYLLSYRAQSSWVREWHSPVSAPLAVRLRLQQREAVDTLFFYIGPRG